MIIAQGQILEGARSVIGSASVRAVVKLASGQALAVALPFLAAPILGRLYTPSDYGLLAAFMAVSGLISTFATLQLQHGIISEASERRVELLVQVCGVLAAFAGFVTLVLAVVLFVFAAEHQTYADARGWLLMLPLSVVTAALSGAIATLANRRCRYDTLARIPVLGVMVSVPVSITLGFAGWGVDGLFTAYALSQAVMALIYWRLFRDIVPKLIAANRPRLWSIAYRHRRFAIYTLPSELLSTFNLNAPTYVLSALGAVPLLGSYSRASRLVGAPLTLLGQSIAMVFRQRAADDYRRTGSCRPIFLKTALALLAIGAIPMTVITLFGPRLFVLWLGPNWAEAGYLAQVLAPMLLMRMVASPLTAVFRFTDRQAASLWLQLFATLLIVGAAALCLLFGTQPMLLFWGYALSYSFVYIVAAALAWWFAAQ
jgi:O-antigen/teichoic acid export membrane protein